MPIVAEPIPHIDPSVKHVGVSKLRGLNADKLRHTHDTLVIQDNDQPLAVLLTYDKFLAIQEQLQSVAATVDLLSDGAEVRALISGLDDVRAQRVEALDDIKAELQKGRGR